MSSDSPTPPRERILEATADLLATGMESVTTRAVSAAARVQAQTIYRHFGDMRGLLDAVAARTVTRFLAVKNQESLGSGPLDTLREGWDLHMRFALANPGVYKLMYGERRRPTSTDDELYGVLRSIVEQAGAAGLLRLPADLVATMIYASGIGVALTLIANDSDPEDAVSITTREAVLRIAVYPTTDPEADDDNRDAARHAIALTALLPAVGVAMTPGERLFLHELLTRLGGTAMDSSAR